MSVSSSWRPPDALDSSRALVRAARHRLSTFRGLGDLVAWVLPLVSIHARKGCGCNRRRKWLNRMFPLRFTGKSMLHRRSTSVSAVFVNRSGATAGGRIELRAGDGEPVQIELPTLADGGTALVLEEWMTNVRSRDRWSWLIVIEGRFHTGSVVCALEGPIEIGLEAAPRRRLEFRQAQGICVVDL